MAGRGKSLIYCWDADKSGQRPTKPDENYLPFVRSCRALSVLSAFNVLASPVRVANMRNSLDRSRHPSIDSDSSHSDLAAHRGDLSSPSGAISSGTEPCGCSQSRETLENGTPVLGLFDPARQSGHC